MVSFGLFLKPSIDFIQKIGQKININLNLSICLRANTTGCQRFLSNIIQYRKVFK